MSQHDTRSREVRDRLARVTDPELDESVLALGFVSDIAIEGSEVAIFFRLPTYWCSANFAWIMAEDMREAVLALAWVERVRMTLDEHMYGQTINEGISAGRSFRDAFGAEADPSAESLDEVRRVFRRKSFGRRQLAVIGALRASGEPDVAVIGMTVAALRRALPGEMAQRYLERRQELFGEAAELPALLDMAGCALQSDTLAPYLSSLRSITVNMEFNGALCRGLLAARYGERKQPAEPELIDFVREAARAR